MQKNWYLVYTKPKCEKKVTATLTKRKIENFCPQNRKQVKHLRKNRLIKEPLFSSYVFVYIEENKLPELKKIEKILSLVYWKGNPAVINEEEIVIIKDFINNYENIKMEKSMVNLSDTANNLGQQDYTREGNLLWLKNRSLRINLPSIGFTLIADLEENKKLIGIQSSFIKEVILQ